jgi:hypothetical protein
MSGALPKPRPLVAEVLGTATTGRGFDARMRWSIYALLIAISAGLMIARIARVRSPDPKNKTPFLSANDRSRWTTIRALGDDGTYAIDHIVFNAKGERVRGWHTIDMVRHRGADSREHYYSSKPTLLTTLLAGEYWLLKSVTGATLKDQTFFVARIMLVLTNVVPLVIALVLLAWMVERVAPPPFTEGPSPARGEESQTADDFCRVFVVAAACFATFLTTYAVTLNNHLTAGISLICGLAAIVPMWQAARFDWLRMAAAGLCFGFLAANELPALSLTAFAGVALAWKSPLKTLLAYVPAVLIVAAAAVGTNHVAHGDWRTPYAHRQVGPKIGSLEDGLAIELNEGRLSPETRRALSLSDRATVTVERRGDRWVVFDPATHIRLALVRSPEGEPLEIRVHAWDNWYDYPGSYWRPENLRGVDRGEASPLTYTFHALIGHHGLFSLTPIWLLSAAGCVTWLRRGDRAQRMLAATTLLVSIVVIGFYLTRPQIDRNYGGGTCCLRWLIWLTPLWLLSMLPAANWLGRSWLGRGVLLVLIAASVFSAHYAADNPWSHPWIFDYWMALGWIKY